MPSVNERSDKTASLQKCRNQRDLPGLEHVKGTVLARKKSLQQGLRSVRKADSPPKVGFTGQGKNATVIDRC